ncbi:hypothetical protein V5N11_033298 [Cardamine amara subsp. amara]|uniref:Myb/SANT-like DNA-binding domain-containing protein n=1 Tax=Cardamine amara subsp. amara TaxID=228776 RepID=A0ABD0Z5J6_CARAN
MEGNCSQGGIVRGQSSCGHFNFQGFMNQNQNQNQKQQCEDNEPCLNGDDQANKSKIDSPWQRVKWMDKMVKLMITALSYITEDSGFDNGDGKKFSVLLKKGKWRSVSKVMDERGYHVSPQQCEDKFNDLNKRYKKLNEMLGRGTCCNVVENPALLDKIYYLNEKEKDEVRRILSSNHLFYEEMCSYHNGNRLHLPHDPALERSILLALLSRGARDNDENEKKHQNEDLHGVLGGPLKRLRQSQSHEEDVGHPNQECNKGYVTHSLASLKKPLNESMSLGLEERKFQIQAEFMEIERQRLKWERFSEKRDRKLEKMRMENEKMKLENERMTLILKRIESRGKL